MKVKVIISVILLSSFIVSCSKKSPTEPNINIIESIAPLNNSHEQPCIIMLYWKYKGSNSGTINYSIYFGKNNPPELYIENIKDTVFTIYNLEKNTTYYWKIGANVDNKEIKSSVWSFITTNNISILPLKVGNKWYYQWKKYDFYGTITSDSSGSVSIKKDTTINNDLCFLYGKNSYFTEKSNGIYIYYKNYANPYLYFKYPANTGDNYNPGPGSMFTSVVSTNISTSVPAGTFNCYNYKVLYIGSISEFYYNYYMAPYIGIVKTELYYKVSGKYYKVNSEELKLFIL